MVKEKIKTFGLTLIIAFFIISVAKSTEECFEKTSRAIFNFNEAVDNAILEPVARGYNKLPEPIKIGTSNFTSNISTLLSIPNNLLKEILSNYLIDWKFCCKHAVGILGAQPAEKMV